MRDRRLRFTRRPALLAATLVVLLVAAGLSAYLASRSSPSRPHASVAGCRPNAMLVNPCRPWFGVAANGNPGAADTRLAQFDYAEKLIGRHVDVFRDYHSPLGSGPNGDLPLNSTELALASQAYLDVNWWPVKSWSQADGHDPRINREIARAAASIKSIAPRKVFLTIGWEPERDVSSDPGSGCRLSGIGTGGTPAQYIAMWRNVERIFRAHHVNNVVWAMDYGASHGRYDCLVPLLWPGNKLVDWVLYDAYSRTPRDTWAKTVGPFYSLLQRDSSPRVDFDAKPWGLGEFSTCTSDPTLARDFYLQAKESVQDRAYPRLHMYIAYDDARGPKASPGCLSDYLSYGQPDNAKQQSFNQFVDTVLGRAASR